MSVWSKEPYVDQLGPPTLQFRELQKGLGQKILNTTRNNKRIYRNKIRVADNGKLTYRLNKSRNIVAVKYWLIKFFTIDVQLQKDRHRVKVKHGYACQLNICWQLKNKNKTVNYILST